MVALINAVCGVPKISFGAGADPGGRWGGYNHPMIDTFAMDFQPQLEVNTLKPSLVFLLILLAKS